MTHKVVAVVLNWNGMDVIETCLDSLIASRDVNMHVLVVDNGSTDGSIEYVGEHYPEVTQLELGENTGFCEGNNRGMQWALDSGADYIFMANNDIKVDPFAVAELVKAAVENPDAGAVGSKIYFMDKPDIIQSAGVEINREKLLGQHRGAREKDDGKFDTMEPVDSLMGCALLFRSKALEEVGFLDTRFHFYHEETDLCLRIGENGWKILFVPKSKIYHRSGYGMIERRVRNIYYSRRNHFLLWKKHPYISTTRAWRNEMRFLLEEYFIARAGKYNRPYIYVIAGAIGIFDYVRGRFGKHPKIIESSFFK